ncbi:MAG: methionine ABC transporter ATP-binding protein [Verrucomicrobia bacterium]|nr:methionine ABC transporter ATP-binding protein [Verrucomicrobiota bacterium]
MIFLKHVSKTFQTPDGPLRAVSRASLHIAPGEIYGIIGFSGAGKSTLLRTINLLERPDPDPQTRIEVDGRDLLALPKPELLRARQSIGFVFQNFHLLNNRTVADNIAFPLEIAGLPAAARAKRVAEVLEIVGLSDKARAFPAKLSGGQRQRVAIARALANHPKVLLCDEPTSSVDPQMTSNLLAFLRQLNERFGLTIVLVTHEMNAVNAICNHVAVMEAGQVVERFSLRDETYSPLSNLGKLLLRDRTVGATLLDDFIPNI